MQRKLYQRMLREQREAEEREQIMQAMGEEDLAVCVCARVVSCKFARCKLQVCIVKCMCVCAVSCKLVRRELQRLHVVSCEFAHREFQCCAP